MSFILRRVKIVATLGPATERKDILQKLVAAGMDCARLNLAHGTLADHERRLRAVRHFSKEYGRPVAVLFDLQGPKIRIGSLKNGKPIQLVRNKTVTITTKNAVGEGAVVSTTYTHLPQDVKKGDPILLDDGRIQLRVLSRSKREVVCQVIHGGWLKEHAGMNLPGTRLSSPALTAKDKQDLKAGLKLGIDAVALSFVRRARDVLLVKEMLKRYRARIPVIAKIERAEALENLDEILLACEGVMVARGDLGVEVSLEKVPILQKQIIQKARRYDTFVITATQMLDSMVDDPTPTRAEVSDVANAIFDGTDCVMLSGETAAGKYPVESLKMMSRIALEAEREKNRRLWPGEDHKPSLIHAVVHSARQAAEEVNAKAIIVFSLTGATARMLSTLKPRKPIIAVTPDQRTYQQMALLWGVQPIISPLGHSTDEMIARAAKRVREMKLLKRGDKVVVVSGTQQLTGATNMMKILTL